MAKKRAKAKPFKWAPYPVSKARDSYELCGEVIAAIKEEPLRYNQSTFGGGPRRRQSRPDSWDRQRIRGGELAACGTVACFAGWIGLLRTGRLLDRQRFSVENIALQDFPHGVQLELSEMFGGENVLIDVMTGAESERWGGILPPEGTPAYARLGIRLMRQFMKNHKAELKAHKLDPVARR